MRRQCTVSEDNKFLLDVASDEQKEAKFTVSCIFNNRAIQYNLLAQGAFIAQPGMRMLNGYMEGTGALMGVTAESNAVTMWVAFSLDNQEKVEQAVGFANLLAELAYVTAEEHAALERVLAMICSQYAMPPASVVPNPTLEVFRGAAFHIGTASPPASTAERRQKRLHAAYQARKAIGTFPNLRVSTSSANLAGLLESDLPAVQQTMRFNSPQ